MSAAWPTLGDKIASLVHHATPPGGTCRTTRPGWQESDNMTQTTGSERQDQAMFQETTIVHGDKPEFYRALQAQLDGLLAGESDAIANAANTSALIFQMLPDINWAGFYFLQSEEELLLGPFQGKPACVRIAVGRGVCGAAVERAETMLVEDVHAFPGHIACDAASRSELVVPLIRDGQVFGVLDLDSPLPGRFDLDDQAGVEALAQTFIAASAWDA